MSRTTIGTYSLFLLIMLFGALLGGSVYEHLVYFPVYLSALPDSTILVSGKFGLHIDIFWLTIHPLVLLTLITTLALNWKFKPRRKRILITGAVYISILVVTQIYFLPELGAFKHSPESTVTAAEWLVRGHRWLTLSWMRTIVMFVATVPLLHALTIFVNNPGVASTNKPAH